MGNVRTVISSELVNLDEVCMVVSFVFHFYCVVGTNRLSLKNIATALAYFSGI